MAKLSVLLAPNELLTPEQHFTAGRFPFMVSNKLDGNRCLLHAGHLMSRTMKDQPNAYLRTHLADIIKYSEQEDMVFDGELFSTEIPFNELQSILRSKDKPIPAHVKFCIFDMMPRIRWGNPAGTFRKRYSDLAELMEQVGFANCELVKHTLVETPEQVKGMYKRALADGLEGLILRNPLSGYKYGRATVNENIIHKLKPFDTLDAKIIGYTQQERVKDGIERKVSELGRTARTFKAEDHELADNLGSLQVRDERGREFSVGWGRGWSYDKRFVLWQDRANLVGRWVEVRFMAVGEHELPRMPQLIRFRDDKE